MSTRTPAYHTYSASLVFDSEVGSGDAGVGVVEEFGQLDECRFSLTLGRSELEDLPAEGLAERVS